MSGLKNYAYLDIYLKYLQKGFKLELLDRNWKWNMYTNLLISLVLTTASFIVYALYKNWNNFDFVLYSSILIPPLACGLQRAIVWPSNGKIVRNLYEKHLEFCEKNYKKHKKLIENYSFIVNFVIMGCMILFFVAVSAILATPLLIYLITGETMVLPLPIYVIGVNANSHPGYEITYLWILINGYVALLAFSYTLVLTFLYIGSVTCQLEIFRLKVRKFENIIHMSLFDANENQLRIQLIQLVEDHIEILDYGGDAETVLSGQYFIDSVSITFLSAILLFYAKIANWIPGYLASFIVTFAAFFDYGLGEWNIMQLEKLNFDVYSISWHRLSVRMQKLYLLFLQGTQTEYIFSCGGLRPVNIEVFSSYCNAVYSYFLLLKDLKIAKG